MMATMSRELFSVQPVWLSLAASILKNIKEQQIPGVSFFMVVPGPLDGAEAFDLMIQAARALTQTMDAELLDESGSTLSIQRERYMREEVIQFQHSSLVS